MGFSKANLRCFNCHKKGHFARECKEPKVEHQNEERRIVTVNSGDKTSLSTASAALVAQQGCFYWSNQIGSLKVTKVGENSANLAQV